MSKLMRISDASIKQLESLSKLTGESKQKILDRAITYYTYEQTLKKANEQYINLKHDSKKWSNMQKESEEWNITLADGIYDD